MRAQRSEAQFSRREKYAPVLRAVPVGELTVTNALESELALYTDYHKHIKGAQPASVAVVAGTAHHGHDLFDAVGSAA